MFLFPSHVWTNSLPFDDLLAEPLILLALFEFLKLMFLYVSADLLVSDCLYFDVLNVFICTLLTVSADVLLWFALLGVLGMPQLIYFVLHFLTCCFECLNKLITFWRSTNGAPDTVDTFWISWLVLVWNALTTLLPFESRTPQRLIGCVIFQ